MPSTLFFRLLDAEDKGNALQKAVAALPQNPAPEAFAVNPESFEQVPGAPFAYWVGDRVRELFVKLPPYEGENRTVKQGLATSDDFRFLRITSEVPIRSLVTGYWISFAKGGEYSTYYSDLYLLVNWDKNGKQLKAWSESLPGTSHWSRRLANVDYYFRPGLTWSQRTQKGLSIRALPKSCIFGHKS